MNGMFFFQHVPKYVLSKDTNVLTHRVYKKKSEYIFVMCVHVYEWVVHKRNMYEKKALIKSQS